MVRRGRFSADAVAARIKGAKKSSWAVIIGSILALFAILGQVAGIFGGISSEVHARLNPHERDYQRLAGLQLGVTPQYLERWLGEAKRTSDVCRAELCPKGASEQTLTMNLYEPELVSVQAVFVDSRLDWYVVTPRTEDLKPPITWLDQDLGELGQVSYTDALAGAGIEPTDVDMFLGPRSSAYVEVVGGGAPADYHGLILASPPNGPAGAEFDRGSADAVEALNNKPFDARVADRFRSRSRPTTFGEFNDDGGIVSRMAGDAENDRVLLYEFLDG